jgi:hypothetical protein
MPLVGSFGLLTLTVHSRMLAFARAVETAPRSHQTLLTSGAGDAAADSAECDAYAPECERGP